MLPADQGQPGASRRPPDTAAASSHGGTSPIPGHLDLTATLAPATAATASANAVTGAAGGTGSTPAPTSSAVNATPHRLRPPPEAAHPAAHRLHRPPQGSSHRPGTRPSGLRRQRSPDHRHHVRTPQQREHREQDVRHTARAAARPPRPHRHRHRATPQHPRPSPPPRPQRPPQSGHASSPLPSRSSTRAASAPTVSTAPPRATRPSRDASAKEIPGGPSYALIGTVPPPTNTTTGHGTHQDPSAHSMPEPAPDIGIPSAAQHDGDTRRVPIHPELVTMLREHVEEFGTGPRGRLFIGPRGGIITDRAYLKVFHEALDQALTAREASSPLLDVPYALRHAAVSTWLNAGVAPPRPRNGPGTAWPSCCGSTPCASPASRMGPCGASSTPPRTNHRSLAVRATARTTMSRHRRSPAPGHGCALGYSQGHG